MTPLQVSDLVSLGDMILECLGSVWRGPESPPIVDETLRISPPGPIDEALRVSAAEPEIWENGCSVFHYSSSCEKAIFIFHEF